MYGIGIIGCGAIAERRHAPEYAADAACRIVGFYDPQTGRAEKLAAEYGARAFGSLEELLADPQIDAVSVCTANSTHAEISIKALQAGKHVLCEKPLATCSKDVRRMITAAEKAGRVLMVAQNQRMDTAHRVAKRLLKQGEMGRVLSFQTAFSHGGPERWLGQKPGAGIWFFDARQTGFGVLGDLGVHKLDVICWLTGEKNEKALAFTATLDKRLESGAPIPVEDNAAMLLRMSSGAIGTLLVSWTSYGCEDNATVLNCTGGVIRLHGPCAALEVVRSDGTLLDCESELQRLENETNGTGIIDLFVQGIKTGVSPIPAQEALQVLEAVENALS